ncbi:[FeFe] hydrogenase, group A [Pelotomaculum terephthalicicum JT]|uniref:[FeFe] hydrogenase, group A n=1 Tax=Pelotomaculum TaxID=191373 RepID=UPI0009CD8FB9|nr:MULTISPECIES: [FeFe] hydrogenase, group A [Pelotomaculum]MCG9969181.1 [FeFe] hydrogenase, group A [Pelotomaculum terephthalicicum JT]OPX89955.1 MAG: Iron hydrogenase 1 [Pelotomaculum sp. PtaB.Bin117]
MKDCNDDVEKDVEKKEITRRTFLKMAAGTGLLAGLTGALAGCADKNPEHAGGKGWLPYQYNVAGNLPAQVRGRVPIDADNPSIVRDDRKCILCGQCLEVCENVESVFGYYSLPVVDETICINCGQCSMACPSGAISERDDTQIVFEALADKNRFVLVQTAPATRVALGEEFGLAPGTWVQGQQVAALRRLGFDAVLDTNFTADLTIMEEATELIKRIKGEVRKPLPQFTSCSPGWIKFCEYFYPELIPNISSCKSPQQMFGALAKTYYAKEKGIDPGNILSVSVMPCTAKKYEARRPEMNASAAYWKRGDLRDVDVVLTTRELARMIKEKQIDFTALPEEGYDRLMGEETGGAVIFGATGGVMEAAARTAYFLITGQEPPALFLNLTPVRGLAGVKEAAAEIPGVGTLRVAVSHGMANGRKILDAVREGRAPWHFVEFMTCPGGCIAGGGQPRTAVPPTDAVREQRLAALYKADASLPKRKSHENAEVAALYRNFLEHPMSELAEELLHTEYHSRADKLKRLFAKVV